MSTYWLNIEDAPQHVKDAASVTETTAGRFRATLYQGPDRQLYALWNSNEIGTPADLWVRLPDCPTKDNK